jgi:hypothetical protein
MLLLLLLLLSPSANGTDRTFQSCLVVTAAAMPPTIVVGYRDGHGFQQSASPF